MFMVYIMKTKELLKILKERAKKAVKHGDLAYELDVSPAYLSMLLAGKRPLTEEVAVKMGFEIDYKKVKLCTQTNKK